MNQKATKDEAVVRATFRFEPRPHYAKFGRLLKASDIAYAHRIARARGLTALDEIVGSGVTDNDDAMERRDAARRALSLWHERGRWHGLFVWPIDIGATFRHGDTETIPSALEVPTGPLEDAFRHLFDLRPRDALEIRSHTVMPDALVRWREKDHFPIDTLRSAGKTNVQSRGVSAYEWNGVEAVYPGPMVWGLRLLATVVSVRGDGNIGLRNLQEVCGRASKEKVCCAHNHFQDVAAVLEVAWGQAWRSCVVTVGYPLEPIEWTQVLAADAIESVMDGLLKALADDTKPPINVVITCHAETDSPAPRQVVASVFRGDECIHQIDFRPMLGVPADDLFRRVASSVATAAYHCRRTGNNLARIPVRGDQAVYGIERASDKALLACVARDGIDVSYWTNV